MRNYIRPTPLLKELEIDIHEVSDADFCGSFVGLEIQRGRIFVKRKLIWRMNYAIEHLLRQRKCSGHALEILLGHITWLMLIRRESLCALKGVYEFVRCHYDGIHLLPDTVLDELRSVRAVLPLLHSNVFCSWSQHPHIRWVVVPQKLLHILISDRVPRKLSHMSVHLLQASVDLLSNFLRKKLFESFSILLLGTHPSAQTLGHMSGI